MGVESLAATAPNNSVIHEPIEQNELIEHNFLFMKSQ